MSGLSRLLRTGLLQNVAALSLLQLFRKLLPIVTMPFLARTLGPSGVGLVAFTQGFGMFMFLLVQFGFDISATREVARHRESCEVRAELFAGVLGAQTVLLILSVVLSFAAASILPAFHGRYNLVAAGLLWASAESLNPTWYFLGLERMRGVALLEIGAKSVSTVLIFSLVRHAGDEWIVLTIYAVAPLISTGWILVIAFRELPLHLPRLHVIMTSFRMGWSAFLFKSSESLYTVANSFVLGLFASPASVGYFGSAEKIARAVAGLSNPVCLSIYPRVTRLITTHPSKAASLARFGVLCTGLGGVLLSILCFVFAPFLVHTLLGTRFDQAILVLRILSPLPTLVSLSHALGYQWLLPLRKDSVINVVFISAAIVNICLAVLLAPQHVHYGMAYAVVSAETLVCCSLMTAITLIKGCRLTLRIDAKVTREQSPSADPKEALFEAEVPQ